MTEKDYIKKLRDLIETVGNDDEIFHASYDSLLEDIIIQELGFKEFFEVFNKEYEGYMWCASMTKEEQEEEEIILKKPEEDIPYHLKSYQERRWEDRSRSYS